MKDILIIEHLRRGDEEAFKYIYERHYVLLCRFANQILNDAALSEEGFNAPVFNLAGIYVLGLAVRRNGHNHIVAVNVVEVYAVRQSTVQHPLRERQLVAHQAFRH